MPKKPLSSLLWDLWCIVSVVGIWPRFIEPNLLQANALKLPINNLPQELEGLKILQFSDLHIQEDMSDYQLNKIVRKTKKFAPDIIVFCGDFLCFGKFKDEKRLRHFLNSFSAPYGCYAVLGNHDYDSCVSINEKGDYDVVDNQKTPIQRGLDRLFHHTHLTKHITQQVKSIGLNHELMEFLKETPFELLNNRTKSIRIGESHLNITGMGEYMLGRFKPEEAFDGYLPDGPGLILSHNPDTILRLAKYPGDVILCGHTHGGQVHLPWMWKRFVCLEHMEFVKGLFKIDNKWAYVNRGVGNVLTFRWFSVPEILELTLTRDDAYENC